MKIKTILILLAVMLAACQEPMEQTRAIRVEVGLAGVLHRMHHDTNAWVVRDAGGNTWVYVFSMNTISERTLLWKADGTVPRAEDGKKASPVYGDGIVLLTEKPEKD
jgi:hypothetical protein